MFKIESSFRSIAKIKFSITIALANDDPINFDYFDNDQSWFKRPRSLDLSIEQILFDCYHICKKSNIEWIVWEKSSNIFFFV